MRQALASLALAAVFIAGCSAVAPTFDGLDGATTTVVIATGADDLATLGVPFVDGQPVVETVDVEITSMDDPANPVALRFSFADGLFTYDPDGSLTTIGFPFQGSVDVALPAGHDYSFEATGADIDTTWLAYGVTTGYVDVTTTTVRLALATMIDVATLGTIAPTSAVDPGQTIDLYLAVDAPGGYSVPVADYAVTYAILPDDGAIDATSEVGTRAVATASPTDDTFTLTATITGWRDVAGVATVGDVTATFEAPYAIVTSLGFDTTAPVVTIDASTEPAYAGRAYALSGTASDDVALDRVQVFEGPVLVGSTDSLEYEVDGVAPIVLLTGSWTVDWIPAEARSHTLTALAIDTAGNEQRASTTIEVSIPTLTFVDGAFGTLATLSAGESVVLRGTATASFDALYLDIDLYPHSGGAGSAVSTVGLVIADGMWTLDWTAPAAGSYNLERWYASDFASFQLTVE